MVRLHSLCLTHTLPRWRKEREEEWKRKKATEGPRRLHPVLVCLEEGSELKEREWQEPE
jgi:hypothetical protein